MALEVDLYAEFLTNVRSVTVYGAIRNNNTTCAKAYVSSDQKTISITYDGQTARIHVPLGINVKGSIGFPIPLDPADLSTRLEILKGTQVSPRQRLEGEHESPWTASSLSNETAIACKDCQTVIVGSGRRVWKDLPRGLWAETLDQWYCHRPEVKGVIQKGYAGSSGPQLEAGIAFVDTCSFVVPSEDCQSLEVKEGILVCTKCSNQLGIADDQLRGYRFYKWSIQVRPTASSGWEQYMVQNIICAQMLELMEDQNVRKFLAFTGRLADAEYGLFIWVFNPEIQYASSKVNDGRPGQAMKVLYEKVNKPSIVAGKLQLTVEDLSLPAGILEQLEKDLKTGHDILPKPARRILPAAAMGTWKASVLHRFNGRKSEFPG